MATLSSINNATTPWMAWVMPACRLVLLAIIVLVIAGCASTSDDDGDMPWAAPATWEGSPYIPGLSQ